ncbi:MAG: hypothetical protein HOE59_02460 [Euryarchaeota archaeon]|nr:hypothetical protein [Euryarchaeota archaeon]
MVKISVPDILFSALFTALGALLMEFAIASGFRLSIDFIDSEYLEVILLLACVNREVFKESSSLSRWLTIPPTPSGERRNFNPSQLFVLMWGNIIAILFAGIVKKITPADSN